MSNINNTQRQAIFMFSVEARPAPGLIQPPIQCIRALFLRAGRGGG
jgi:hypothetical protein